MSASPEVRIQNGMVELLGKLHPALAFLVNGAWFSAATVSFFVYLIMMKKRPTMETR